MQQNGQNKLHEAACIGKVGWFGAQFQSMMAWFQRKAFSGKDSRWEMLVQ
jgi:hypothetical protein